MKTQQVLRELADSLDFIEDEYGAQCSGIWGQAVLGREHCNFKNINIDKFWNDVKEDDYGFIGIMPNQWRPEIYIYATIKDVRINLYTFIAEGYHNYDGGFLGAYPTIKKIVKNAPNFIHAAIDKLYSECYNEKKCTIQNEIDKLEQQKENLQKKLHGII